MADTVLETALAALVDALEAAVAGAEPTDPAPEVIRNADLPEEVPEIGLIILRDGAQGGVEESFSPLRYHVEHTAEVVVLAPDEGGRDALVALVSAGLVEDRTLGGEVEWLQVDPVSLDVAEFEGAAGVLAVALPVTMAYTTLASPAG